MTMTNPMMLDPDYNDATHLLTRWRRLYDLQRQRTSNHEKARTEAYTRLQREMKDWHPEHRDRLLKLVRELE